MVARRAEACRGCAGAAPADEGAHVSAGGLEENVNARPTWASAGTACSAARASSRARRRALHRQKVVSVSIRRAL